MRLVYLFAVILLLLPSSHASWQTYQNDLRNSGSSDGAGYYPAKTSNFTSGLGTDFQPLADDINQDGNKEIIIFANESLIIFNPQLEILSQTKIGAILGQPTLFNLDNDSLVEIIFNARQNSGDYFFAYQLNQSSLHQEFNISLQKDANFSGIKCLNLNGANACIFKDRQNYVHIVNLSSKTDNSYNTSVYNESRQTVPAIGDIDNDGRYEAVWWFNPDSSGGYGLMVFDINNRSLETNFDGDGAVDNIFVPFFGSALSFALKGQPVLVDLNKDGRLEIAAGVFYDDYLPNFDTYNDWFTELFVYSHNGTKLFSKCGINDVLNNGCNDGGSQTQKWEGTNPFILDADSNGVDDVCLIKDKKSGAYFANMALNCYNYSGDEIMNINLTNSDTIKGAIAADMTGDGVKEIITMTNIYLLNGTSIFFYNLDAFNPIAVDLDGNKGLDLLWTKNGETKVFLDSNNYSIDLAADEIIFSKINETHANVSVIIKNIGQAAIENVKASVYNMETLENNSITFSIKKNANFTFTSVLGLSNGQKVFASVDPNNEINESDEKNNELSKEFLRLPYVYVSWNGDDSLNFVMNGVKDYIKENLVSGYYTDREDEADFTILLRKFHSLNEYDRTYTRERHGWGYDSYSTIDYFDESYDAPYAGLAGSYRINNKNYIAVYGNRIDGDLAAAKELIKHQAELLSGEGRVFIVTDENPEAVKIYDYLHQPANLPHYDENTIGFLEVVKNALNGRMFSVENKNVTSSNNINLRLRNLKPDFSSNYFEYLNSTGMPIDLPVVMSHGLFSNLSTWEATGGEVSNTGRDVWLIEITGGPGQDCDSCLDYTYYNLTDIFVPALLNGVLTFTNKTQLQYVGFSNGCRSALDSLERGMFDSGKVETFVAVGCPGAFEGNSTTSIIVNSKNRQISENLNSKNFKHTSLNKIIHTGLFDRNYISKDAENRISLNLFKFYEDLIISRNDNQPGNIDLSNFVIIQGNGLDVEDGIVPVIDEHKIFSNVNKQSGSKKHFNVFAVHSSLDTKERTESIIKKSLNKEQLNLYEKTINLINQSN